MTEIISSSLALLVLVSGLMSLVVFARRDTFAGPGTGYVDIDDLGAVVRGRRRPAQRVR